ncbi:MAG TPA: hypothetical protein VJB06_02450 [archaeon]|nr:hypothetical protein [archaeon]
MGLFVDDALVSDIARNNKKVTELARRCDLQESDSTLDDLFSKGVNKNSFFREISRFSEERENDDLV